MIEDRAMSLKTEERKIIDSIILPLILVCLMGAVWAMSAIGGWELGFLGVHPRHWDGLPGIITSPFIHADFSHLASNAIPMLVLGSSLIYFYKDIALRVFLVIYIATGLMVWIGARPSWHIGASGVVYGLAAFVFVSGLIRKHTGLMAMALIVAFLYGSMIWGLFPEFFPGEPISWESHLFGIFSGVIVAWFYRKEGPKSKEPEWDEEEDEEDSAPDDADAYWKNTLSDDEIREIKRTYRP